MQIDQLTTQVLNQIVGYLPSAIAGLLLLGLGVFAGWFAKRLVMQTLVILRLHRVLLQFHWGRSLRRVDVRKSLYNVFGNLCGLVIFLVFLNAALTVMKLTVVSELIGTAVVLFPRAAAALLIFGSGWLLAAVAANGVRRALDRENLSRSRLVVSYVRSMLIVFFAAMALAQLDISRDIVVIGFTVAFCTLGIVTVLLAVRGATVWFKEATGRDTPTTVKDSDEPEPADQ